MDFSYDNRFDDSCSNLSVYNVPAPFHIIRMGNNMFSPERLGEEQEKQKKKKEKERLVLKMRRQGGERENSYDSIERLVYKKRQNGDVVIVVAVVMGSMDK